MVFTTRNTRKNTRVTMNIAAVKILIKKGLFPRVPCALPGVPCGEKNYVRE